MNQAIYNENNNRYNGNNRYKGYLCNTEEHSTDKRKLHLTIPTELWGIIYAKQDMARIDELVTDLLCKFYGVELHKKLDLGGD